LLAHELPHDSAAQLEYATSRIPTLVPDQASVFSAIRDAIDSEGLGRRIFLKAPGGCGKTYLASMLLAYARGRGKVALAVASSGVAATLMPLGRTAHSRFKIPIDIHARSMCNFESGSDTAKLLKRTRLIVWDEATMAHRHCFEAVDRSIRDTIGNDAANRISWSLCGDFRQIPPVVRKGSIVQIIGASFCKSPLWSSFTKMELSTNMRVQTCVKKGNAEDASLLGTWASWLLAVGINAVKSAARTPPRPAVAIESEDEEDTPNEASATEQLKKDLREALPDDGRQAGGGSLASRAGPSAAMRFASRAAELATKAICIPRALCQKAGKGIKDLLLSTFPDLESVNPTSPQECVDKLNGRMVLTVLNEDVAKINKEALDLFPGDPVQSISVNKLVEGEEGDRGDLATPEFMDSVDHASIPEHILTQKVGMVVMLLRNLAAQSGDCNGTRYIVTRIGTHNLGARAMDSSREIIIPKIFLTPGECGLLFAMKRFQFPVRAAFAATINKAQGTTLERLGLWLRDSVFGHGQLYVALSRVGDPRKVLVGALSAAYDAAGRIVTNNVVYSQLFNDNPV